MLFLFVLSVTVAANVLLPHLYCVKPTAQERWLYACLAFSKVLFFLGTRTHSSFSNPEMPTFEPHSSEFLNHPHP